jgi:hypothetical protein
VTGEVVTKVSDAHAGLANYDNVSSVNVEIVLGGRFWPLRGVPDLEPALTVSMDAHRGHITMAPFPWRDRCSVFDVDPERLAIRTKQGRVVEQRNDSRSSIPPFDLQTTAWNPIQIAHFGGAAKGHEFTQPFSFTCPGVGVREIEPGQEPDRTWRRLAVHFSPSNANHTPIRSSTTRKEFRWNPRVCW